MDSVDSRNVALFSIHPNFAFALLEGTKQVEFRKTRFPSSLDTIVIYATAPVKMIVGYMRIARIVVSTPRLIWRRYGSVGGIERKAYWDYFSDSSHAVALETLSAHAFQFSQPLSSIEVKRAPQSFQYLDQEWLTILQGMQLSRAA